MSHLNIRFQTISTVGCLCIFELSSWNEIRSVFHFIQTWHQEISSAFYWRHAGRKGSISMLLWCLVLYWRKSCISVADSNSDVLRKTQNVAKIYRLYTVVMHIWIFSRIIVTLPIEKFTTKQCLFLEFKVYIVRVDYRIFFCINTKYTFKKIC